MSMTDNDFNYYFKPTREREHDLWGKCTFVFDTSALLEFYYFPKKSQDEIFSSTFEKIKGRLWIPHHVKYEYLKNRENTLKKPIDEKYKRIETDHIKSLENDLKNIKTTLNDFINQTKKEEAHPYIDNKIPQDLDSAYKAFETKFIEFKSRVELEFKDREEEINILANKDTVLESFNRYFDIGKDYDFNRIMDIIAEGEIRYRNEVPPGYKDEKNKKGIQKYGDLIIWKQLLDYAKQKERPIIFVTNDAKEDWCYTYKRSNETRIERPREDLIREFRDAANMDFWMYTFSQFLYSAREILNTNITQEVIDEAVTASNSKTNKIRYDGFYRTIADDLDEEYEDDQQYQYYYIFYPDGLVQTRNGMEKEYTTGEYKFVRDKIEIHFKFQNSEVKLIGTVNEDYIKLAWSSTAGHKGSERGFFYQNVDANNIKI